MDERLSNIEKEKQQALQNSNSLYEGLFQDNQNLWDQQKAYADQYERTQNDTLDKQLAFQTQLINQQKETARQNKETESKKAKNDYFSYINPYGLQAESFAGNGLLNSGVSETAKLGGYNTYQNRLAAANKAMQDAFVQYDNDLNQARLNNDVQKAQNALTKLQMQLQYSENFYNNKSSLAQSQLSNNQSLSNEYFNRYNTEYNNIQEEKAREEAIRQFNEQMAYQRERDKIADQQWQQQYNLSKQKASSSSGGGYSLTSEGSGSLTNNSTPVATQNNGSPNTINGSEIILGPYQTLSSFLGSSGNVGGDGTTNIDNEKVYPTVDGKFYVYDRASGNYVDVSSLKKKSTASSSSTNSNKHTVDTPSGKIGDNSFWGNLYNSTLGRFF